MKKKKEEAKKLQLSKETLRVLKKSDAKEAIGGICSSPATQDSSCASWWACCGTM
jgi:hypothetical protein